jgi:hypothetical protein
MTPKLPMTHKLPPVIVFGMNTLLGERAMAMTTDAPCPAGEPPHPVYAMTPDELERYRVELERGLAPDAMPQYAEARTVMREQLAAVLAEQAKPGRRQAGNDRA